MALDSSERAEKREELNELRQRIHALQTELDKTRSQHDRVRNELRDIELSINKHVRELDYVNERLRHQAKRLQQLQRDQLRFEHDLSTQRELLSKQMRASYIIGRQEYLKLLLNQEQPASVGRSFAYYNYFIAARSEGLKDVYEALHNLDQTRHAIADERVRLNDLAQHAREQKAELETAMQSRSAIVARLQLELDTKGQSLSRLLDDEQQLRRLLNVIDNAMPELHTGTTKHGPFAQLKGKLRWPVTGKVRSVFGQSRDHSNVRWNGIVINAPEGREVRAISYGRVAYADWLRGYGLLIIIDHGDGYMSLYAHNQSLTKETGDWVEAGEQIANVGTSGGQTASGLYFEVRHNGAPINPSNWCKRG